MIPDVTSYNVTKIYQLIPIDFGSIVISIT